MFDRLKTIEKLKEVKVFRDSEGNVTGQKGTTCARVSDGRQEYIEKQWVSGDWVFPGDYEYNVEKRVYEVANSLDLPVPRLWDHDDAERKLLIEYIPGVRVEWPCTDQNLLKPILAFFDAFSNITFPASVDLFKMNGAEIYKYRLNQLKFIFPDQSVWARVDSIYESFLHDIPYRTLPFDRILKNTLQHNGTLYFLDFEWTISGPYEFTLARVATEFREYENSEILSRVKSMDLYHLFLLRFYMYGQEPEFVYRYLRDHLRNEKLRELFEILTCHEYADEPWCST